MGPLDIYTEPDPLDEDVVANLGPFAPLVGTWEGAEGLDTAPDRDGPEQTPYRERLTFEPAGPVVNGPQVLYGLKYATTAWPMGEEDPFHEELGYWLWDPERKQAMRMFMVPRGVAVLAGGTVEPGDSSFTLAADVGSEVYGIVSNPFLDKAFKTVHYEVTVKVEGDGVFSYEEDTVLKVLGADELFHHTDANRLKRV